MMTKNLNFAYVLKWRVFFLIIYQVERAISRLAGRYNVSRSRPEKNERQVTELLNIALEVRKEEGTESAKFYCPWEDCSKSFNRRDSLVSIRVTNFIVSNFFNKIIPAVLKNFINRYRRKRPKVDASIFDSALSHTRRLDASEKREEFSVSTFGRIRLLTSFESSPISVNFRLIRFHFVDLNPDQAFESSCERSTFQMWTLRPNFFEEWPLESSYA